MIAVTFALPAESKDLVSRLQSKHAIACAHANATRGEIGSRSVTIFHTGVGRRITEKGLTEFLDQHSFKILISSGFAGGVNSDLNAGDLFMADNISDVELLTVAEVALTTRRPHRGKLLTSSGIIHSTAKRIELARERAADAIDMESDVVAQTCAERGVRMLSLRVISDTANEPFPAPPSVLFDVERQKTPLASLASHLLANPGAIPRLIRFNRQIRQARENLTNALVALIEHGSFDNAAR
jgi:adenosylhomocysteine nucleosidase